MKQAEWLKSWDIFGIVTCKIENSVEQKSFNPSKTYSEEKLLLKRATFAVYGNGVFQTLFARTNQTAREYFHMDYAWRMCAVSCRPE